MRGHPGRGVKRKTCSKICKGLGFRFWGSGFRFWGSGFRIKGLGFRVWGLAFRVWSFGVRVRDGGILPPRNSLNSLRGYI